MKELLLFGNFNSVYYLRTQKNKVLYRLKIFFGELFEFLICYGFAWEIAKNLPLFFGIDKIGAFGEN